MVSGISINYCQPLAINLFGIDISANTQSEGQPSVNNLCEAAEFV
jgi:hypothetical protein